MPTATLPTSPGQPDRPGEQQFFVSGTAVLPLAAPGLGGKLPVSVGLDHGDLQHARCLGDLRCATDRSSSGSRAAAEHHQTDACRVRRQSMRDCPTDDPGRQRLGGRPRSAERAVNRSRRRGSAAVELGVSIPLILLLTLGATDFGRLFYSAVTVVGSSVAGAFFGAHSNLYSVNSSGMQGLASSSATNLESVTANGTEYCDCPDDPASGPDDTARTVDCTNAVCTVSGYESRGSSCA